MVLTSIAPTPGLAFSGVVEPEQTLDLVATTDCIWELQNQVREQFDAYEE